MHDVGEIEEPNVVPLIDVSLVILVMLVMIASHAARTLPLAIPRAPAGVPMVSVDVGEGALLTIKKDGTFHMTGPMADDKGKFIGNFDEDADDNQRLGELLAALPTELPDKQPGNQPDKPPVKRPMVVTLKFEAGAKHEALVKALDCIMRFPELKVAFGEAVPSTPPPAPADAPPGATTRP